MTAPAPLDLRCKSPEELKTMIRHLEQTCAMQDKAAHAGMILIAALELRQEKLEAVVEEAKAMRTEDMVSTEDLDDALDELEAWDKAHR